MDSPDWSRAPVADDFLVAVGKTKSNSVYHIVSIRAVARPARITRYYLRVYHSTLFTAIQRELHQHLFVITWHSRNKRKS